MLRLYIDQLTVVTNNDLAYLCFHERKLGHMFFILNNHSGLEYQNNRIINWHLGSVQTSIANPITWLIINDKVSVA